MPSIPRGAGSGLAGGAIGDGLIVEFARFNREISGLDLERRTVRVGAGVVLDQLNEFLKPHGFCFGPDVATSSRATLGGMIANNSSGAHVPVYGCTADHVRSLEVVMADGRIETLGAGGEVPAWRNWWRDAAAEIRGAHAGRLAQTLAGLRRGPLFARAKRQPSLAGSEGTLAAILSAELKIVPLPRRKTSGPDFFRVGRGGHAGDGGIARSKPAAIEHMDRVLFDQTRGQLNFKAARDLLELDAKPCEAILLVEFFDDAGDASTQWPPSGWACARLLLRDAGRHEPGLGHAQSRPSLLDRLQGRRQTGHCHRRHRRASATIAGIRRRAAVHLGARSSRRVSTATPPPGLLHVRPVLDLHDAGT